MKAVLQATNEGTSAERRSTWANLGRKEPESRASTMETASSSRRRGLPHRLTSGGRAGSTRRGLRDTLADLLRPLLRRYPSLRNRVASLDTKLDLARHTVARVVPQVIQPDPRELYITLTAQCNLRCIGCRYGRDFMPGSELTWEQVRDLLDDAKQCGIRNVRLYGGEPLLHKDLPRIVEHAVNLGLTTWVSTNGILLKQKFDDLYAAGLRTVSVGFYGTGEEYDRYVQRPDQFARLEAGVAHIRDRYGMDVALHLAWVLMRPTCSLRSLHETWAFAERYSAFLSVSLIHYSLPYFTEGPDRCLQFVPEDRPKIDEVVTELIRLQSVRPDLLTQSLPALRSIPDWLLKGPGMKVPCDRYRLIWVGADGTVQLCYVTFKLGNLHERRLSQLLFTPEHGQACRKAFALECPNCHCSYHNRIDRDLQSSLRYFR